MAACRTVPFSLCTENTAPQTPRSSSASGQKNQKEIRLPLQEKGKHLKNLITIQGKKWRAQQRVLIIAQRVLCAISKNSRCGDTPGKDQRVSSSWKARQQWAARECRRRMTHSLLPLSSKPSGLNSSASGVAVERGGGGRKRKNPPLLLYQKGKIPQKKWQQTLMLLVSMWSPTGLRRAGDCNSCNVIPCSKHHRGN